MSYFKVLQPFCYWLQFIGARGLLIGQFRCNRRQMLNVFLALTCFLVNVSCHLFMLSDVWATDFALGDTDWNNTAASWNIHVSYVNIAVAQTSGHFGLLLVVLRRWPRLRMCVERMEKIVKPDEKFYKAIYQRNIRIFIFSIIKVSYAAYNAYNC